jgi:hypothetical protein
MALVTKSSRASMDASTGMYAPQISGLIAGEDLDPVSPCRIGSDGKVYMSNGTADDAQASFAGFCPTKVLAGEAVTLFSLGARFRYGSGLTPDSTLYIAATKGRLDTAATTGDAVGVARVLTATDIQITRIA